MESTLQRSLVGLAVLAALSVPRTAAAQDERGNIALGYNYGYLFSPNGGRGLSLPTGVFLSAGEWTGRSTLLVGEVAESHTSAGGRADDLTFAGGLRFMARRPYRHRGSPRPFAEILIGGARLSGGAGGTEVGGATALALEPGIGVDSPIAYRTALRIAGHYDIYRNAGGMAYAFRLDIGLAFRFGPS
jgi:hypothetical protein